MAQIGHSAGPDDVFFALRGMRTLSARLERHQRNAMEVARWLQTRPEVSRVLYPALPEDPGHAIWKRDFLGASGLFGVVLKAASKEQVYAMIDALDLFGIGASWGGFEPIQPAYPQNSRTAKACSRGPGRPHPYRPRVTRRIWIADLPAASAKLAGWSNGERLFVNPLLTISAVECRNGSPCRRRREKRGTRL